MWTCSIPQYALLLHSFFPPGSWINWKWLLTCGSVVRREAGKPLLLRLLHGQCRRSVLIAGSISPEIASLPALLRPTLLFDKLQFNGSQKSKDLERWLRAGNARGVRSTLGGRLVRTRLHRHLTEQCEQAVQERIDEPEAWVVLALFILSHRTEASGVLVGDIAHEVNKSLRSSGDADLTAKKFGLILKTLGIGTRKLGSPGRGIPLTYSVKRRIHELLRSFNVQPSRVDDCILCKELTRTGTMGVPTRSEGEAAAVNV